MVWQYEKITILAFNHTDESQVVQPHEAFVGLQRLGKEKLTDHMNNKRHTKFYISDSMIRDIIIRLEELEGRVIFPNLKRTQLRQKN